MSITTRITAAFLILVSVAGSSPGDEPPAKSWVWLTRQGVWGYGYLIGDGPHTGLWRIDPDSKRAPEEAEPADSYGLAEILNRHRVFVGLHPLAYDHDLSMWAAHNNVKQASHGLGHHVNPNCYQNSAWNTPDARSTAEEWMNSPGHRANMLSPNVSRFGIAYGPGPYWRMNAP